MQSQEAVFLLMGKKKELKLHRWAEGNKDVTLFHACQATHLQSYCSSHQRHFRQCTALSPCPSVWVGVGWRVATVLQELRIYRWDEIRRFLWKIHMDWVLLSTREGVAEADRAAKGGVWLFYCNKIVRVFCPNKTKPGTKLVSLTKRLKGYASASKPYIPEEAVVE